MTNNHHNYLNQLISANVPAELARGITEFIAQDNDFLQKPELLQSGVQDENWAFAME